MYLKSNKKQLKINRNSKKLQKLNSIDISNVQLNGCMVGIQPCKTALDILQYTHPSINICKIEHTTRNTPPNNTSSNNTSSYMADST